MSGFSGAGAAANAAAGFSATKNNVAQGGITTNTYTKITFTTEVYDVGGYYDDTNSRWTPPAGLVQMKAALYFNGGVLDQSFFAVAIYKNGGAFKQILTPSPSAIEFAVQVSCEDNANGTDYYEVYGMGDGVGNKQVSGSVSLSFFQGSTLRN